MAFKVAERGSIAPFIVMDVMRDAARRQAEGGDVIHLEVGQPSGQAPEKVRQAAARALAAEPLGYTLAMGTDRLRERISHHYAKSYGVRVPAESICVTTGSSAGFLLSFLAAFAPGDRVAVAAPGYPAYRNILTALGIECVNVPVGPASRWQLSVEVLEKLEGRLDGAIVASPSNPTGSMLSAHEVAELATWCELRGIRLISDEIYHGITFGHPAATAAGMASSPHAVIVNSFSKYYAMTGWRLGWMVMPVGLAPVIERLLEFNTSGGQAFLQRAGVAAIEQGEPFVAEQIARCRAGRDLVTQRLGGMKRVRVTRTEAAFYLMFQVEGEPDSYKLAMRLVDEARVGMAPGAAFGTGGEGYLRLCFAASTKRLAEAMDRLEPFFN